MPTTTRISAQQVPDHGGHPVVVRLDWTQQEADDGDVFGLATRCRMLLRVEDPANPGAYLDTGPVAGAPPAPTPRELFSGRPGQVMVDTDADGRTGYHIVYPRPPLASDPAGWRLVDRDGTNVQSPVSHWCRGYLPKLAAAVYWVQVQVLNPGTLAWSNVGTPVPLRVLPRARIRSIYDIRRRIPNPPYLPGQQDPGDETMLEG